jgi:hypothetical protein
MPFSAVLGFLGAQEQASATEAAANTSAAAQRESARLAAEAARFRPVGITTRYGSSNFQMSPEGYLTGAGYNVSPELKAYQDRLSGLAGGALTQAEMAQQQYAPLQTAASGLFGIGQQYLGQPADQRLGGIANQYLGAQPNFGVGDIGQRLLAQGQDQQLTDIARQQFAPSAGAQALTSLGQQYVGQSPQDVAARYMQQQQDLLAPSRERQMAQLQNQLFQTGRSGLSVGATGARPSGAAGLGASSPELEAYYNALAQQDVGLAAQAQQAGQQQASFGAGLLGQGQALGQGQIGFGADLLARQQAQEAQRLGLGSQFINQQQALEQGRYGFGADLLSRQQAMEQGRTAFGAGLFGTGANILGQYQAGQVGALRPFTSYLGTGQSIEQMGQEPLTLGAGLGGQAAAYGANAGKSLLAGGLSAAITQQGGQGFSPEAGLYSAFANSPQFNAGVQNLFSGFGQPVQTGYTGSPYMTGAQNDQLAASFAYNQQPSSSYFIP